MDNVLETNEEQIIKPPGNNCKTCCILPQRYLTALMAAIGVTIAYIIRNSLTVIIKYLVKGNEAAKIVKKSCHFNTSVSVKLVPVSAPRHWNKEAVSAIKSSFFYGYLLSHLPGGYLSDQYGGKHILGGSILITAIINLTIMLVLRHSDSHVVILILNFFFGVTQGAIFPALHSLISSWTPSRDIGGITGICFASTQFATVTNNLLTFKILESMAWYNVFYFYSGAACCWWLIWILLCYSNPYKNPFINTKETQYLHEHLDGHVIYTKKKVPWCKLLTSIPVWAFVSVQVGHTWIWHSMIHDLPRYMSTVMGFSTPMSHLYASLPYGVMGICTILLGFISDLLINHELITRNTSRQMFTTIGAMGPGIFMICATLSGCRKELVIGMFTVAMHLMCNYYAGSRVIGLDLAPNFSGIIMGLANGLGALPGVIKPLVVKELTIKETAAAWRKVFVIALSFSMSTNLVFAVFGTADEQSWNHSTTTS